MITKTKTFFTLLLSGLLLAAGSALAADDSGPREHAEGQYDASTNTYIVETGDDLSDVAERFGTTVGELETLNTIPAPGVRSTSHPRCSGTTGRTTSRSPTSTTIRANSRHWFSLVT